MVQLCAEVDLRLTCCRIGEQKYGRRLRDAFREGIVEDERIVPSFSQAHVMFALRHLVRFTFAEPLDLFQTDTGQFLDCCGKCLWLLFIVIVRRMDWRRRVEGGGGAVQRRKRPGVLEQAEIERLFVRLNRPGYCVFLFDVDPAD